LLKAYITNRGFLFIKENKNVTMMPLLNVKNLTTYYKTLRGYVRAVENVSFNVEKGEAMGLAGESGCGKTTTALSIMSLLPPNC